MVGRREPWRQEFLEAPSQPIAADRQPCDESGVRSAGACITVAAVTTQRALGGVGDEYCFVTVLESLA